MSLSILSRRTALGAVVVTIFAGAALAEPGIVRVRTPAGEVLADANGMTLYVFAKDAPGVSNCYDQCAEAWPPLLAPADATTTGDFAPIPRRDGQMQWAYKGQPLYLWQQDRKPGDTTGDGYNGVWRAAR